MQKNPTSGLPWCVSIEKKNGRQNFQGKLMIEEQRNLKAIKKTNKREKLKQLASFCPKFLKDDLM
jgi:hypothetical protein